MASPVVISWSAWLVLRLRILVSVVFSAVATICVNNWLVELQEANHDNNCRSEA